MQLSGFRSFDEAYQYARELARTKSVVAQMNKNTRVIVISDKNLQLIGLQLSYNDYEKFYEKNFSPVQVTKRYLLSEPAEVVTPRERDLQDEMQSKAPTQEDINEQQKEAQHAEETYTIPEEETVPKKDSVNSEAPADGVSIADTVSTAAGVEGEHPENTSDDTSDAFILPEEKPSQPSASVDKQKVTEKKKEQAQESQTQPKDKTKPSEPVEKKPAQVVPKQQDEPASDEPVIIFDDDWGAPASGNNNTTQPTDDSIEDEYYDLDGF